MHDSAPRSVRNIEGKGYIIKEIRKSEVKEAYFITIVNRLGDESIVEVPKGQLETEAFEVDDVVFLDNDGLIEQAYEKYHE